MSAIAPTQLKHARLARQLDASTSAEKAACERAEELQQELQDISSICHARMCWLERAASDAERRAELVESRLRTAASLEVRTT